MGIDLDIADDFASVCDDFHEQCTLKVDGDDDTTLWNVLTEPHQYKELEPTGGQVVKAATMFVWPCSESSQPPLGAVIVDEDDIYWTILTIEHKQHVETYEALCLNLNIVTATANKATLLRATYGKADANEADPSWVGVVSGAATPTDDDIVEARFQPSEETSKLLFGAEYTETAYRVYFEADVPLKEIGAEYRLVDADGFRYRVLKYYNEKRLDKLPVAIALRIVEGDEYHGQGPPVET